MQQILIQETDFQKARKKIGEAKKQSGIIVFSSNDDELNRKILEKESIDILLLNQKGRKDKMKQRDSGFNQVLAKLAKKENVTIGIDLDEILNSSGKERVEILGRIRQNIRLCNKNKVKMIFVTFKKDAPDSYGLKSLGAVLGMPTWMVSKVL